MLSNNTRAVSLGLVLILIVGTFGYVYTLQSQIQTLSDEVMDLQLEVWNLEVRKFGSLKFGSLEVLNCEV